MKTIKPNKKIIKPFVKEFFELQYDFFKGVADIEKRMQQKVGDKDIEFFWVDGEMVAVGTPLCPKKMKLLHVSSPESMYYDK